MTAGLQIRLLEPSAFYPPRAEVGAKRELIAAHAQKHRGAIYIASYNS